MTPSSPQSKTYPEHARKVADLGWRLGDGTAHAITATTMPVYFARPRSPWQRGTNENLNRIVRVYLPEGVEITSSPDCLAMVAAEINDRLP